MIVKKNPKGWKYKCGRRLIPDMARHDVRVYLFALLEEAQGECDRLSPKVNGPTADISGPLFGYWDSVRRFLTGRIDLGTASIPDSRYQRAEMRATMESVALLTNG